MISEERMKELNEMKKELNLLTIEEVAELIQVHVATARRLMEKENFPVIKIGKRNLVRFESLKECLDKRLVIRGE